MRRVAVALLFAALAAAAALGVFLAASREAGRKVVFVDAEAVVAAEKRRLFSLALRGELSREEAEERAGRFPARFGEVVGAYGQRGYLVLEAGAVLSGGRDVTAEVLERLASRGEEE